MSHIVSFSISGLAGREDICEHELNRDVNVFFGVNGSGKTSLLKILHSAMQNDARILGPVPFTSATVKIYSISYDKVFTRTIDKPEAKDASEKRVVRKVRRRTARIDESEVVGLPEDISLAWKCTTKTTKKAKSTHWIHEYLPTSRLHVGVELPTPRLHLGVEPQLLGAPEMYWAGPQWPTEERLDLLFANSVQALWTRYSGEVDAEVRSAQEKGLAAILKAGLATTTKRRKSKARMLDAETAYSRIKKFLARQRSASIVGSFRAFEKRYKQDENLQSVVADIDQVETSIAEAGKSRDLLESLIGKMYTGNKHLKFEERSIQVEISDGRNIGLASLSSGEKHLLRIFLPTLLATKNCIMIDEPEMSLHVDWQRELIAAMRSLNPSAQVIVATHSPEIMADISDDKIFSL